MREVQERRAREAAREAEAERQRVEATTGSPQLELLPPAETPTINPLVAAALKRIERAHQPTPTETRQPSLAVAVGYAPEREEHDWTAHLEIAEELHLETEVNAPPVEKTHNLIVVASSNELEVAKPEPPPPPKRLIADDPNDPALNYLDSIAKDVCVDEVSPNRASAFRRLIGALFDLIICGVLTSPIAAAMWYTGSDLKDIKTIAVLAACLVVVTFIYLTLTTALTGRTWAMRLLSLRVIDTKTGLIPTGGQSVGRSFFYLMSLATAGFGILFALVSREGYTAHDRFTRTAVITN